MQNRCRNEWFPFRFVPSAVVHLFIQNCGNIFLYLLVLFPLLSFCQLPSTSGLDNLSSGLQEQVLSTLRESSKTFQLVSNNGQLGLPAKVIAYFTTGSQTIFVEKDRLRIVVWDPVKEQHRNAAAGKKVKASQNYRYNSFSIRFKNCREIRQIEKLKPFATRRNFINSLSMQQPVTNVIAYEEITLKNVYDGIDLRLYSQEEGQLEFDWIIWPHADPGKIKMQFKGQKKITVTGQGQLMVVLPMGNFILRMPESYYVTPGGKKKAGCRFAVAKYNEVVFRLNEKKDNRYPLIIDPYLLWGTFFDGGKSAFDEYLYAIEYNYTNQLIYCAGVANLQVTTSYVAALSNGYSGIFKAGQDVLIYALRKNGQSIEYITYLGGSGNEVATGIAIGDTSVFICGYTKSADFPVTDGSAGTTAAFDHTLKGTQDGFVAVFNTALNNLIYCSYLGGTGLDEALTIRAVNDQTFYVSLHCFSGLPVSSPNYLINFADSSFGGAEEAWIGRFSSFNQIDFGTYVGGSDVDIINDFQLLSDGDVVFTGTTKQITEINDHIPGNATGSDAFFGHIDVPVAGPVSFMVIDKFGGSGTDNGYGIYSIGDSVSIIVGDTKSGNFPLGSGYVFQGSLGGNTDGFVARINNDGTGGYKASFTGGSGTDLLVSVRPVIVSQQVALLCFGTTNSTNLAVANINDEPFFSGTNSGGQDMMFLICDMTFSNKLYLSYIGGTGNDYLGTTGKPVASNHLFYNAVDSVLYVGTTTHSFDSTQHPKFVGRGIADVPNAFVPVFDQVKNNGINDTHVIFSLSTKTVYTILAVNWIRFDTYLGSDCGVRLSWEVSQQASVARYVIERSWNGRNFQAIAEIPGGNLYYNYTDPLTVRSGSAAFYRIRSLDGQGHSSYSKVNIVRLCNAENPEIKIYPTIITDHITIDIVQAGFPGDAILQLYTAAGELAEEKRISLYSGKWTFSINPVLHTGYHFLVLKDAISGNVYRREKLVVVKN